MRMLLLPLVGSSLSPCVFVSEGLLLVGVMVRACKDGGSLP